MKTCSKYREQIACLAMDAVEVPHEPELRAHLDNCSSCRRYLQEMSALAGNLRAAPPPSGHLPSASFHRRVVDALAAAERRPVWGIRPAQIWGLWPWRLVLSAATVAALVLAARLLPAPRSRVPQPTPLVTRTLASPPPNPGLAPTFSNYEIIAHQSLDKLDELLTAQGNRNLPPSPIYTAALSSRLNPAD